MADPLFPNPSSLEPTDSMGWILKERQSAQSNAMAGLDESPDDAARAMELSNATGAKPELVNTDLEGFEKQTKAAMVSSLLNNNEYLRDYANSHPLAATISNDDWGKLDEVSQATQRIGGKGIFDAAVEGFQTGFGDAPVGSYLDVPRDPKERFKWGEEHPGWGALAGVVSLLGAVPEGGFRTISGLISGTVQGGAQAWKQITGQDISDRADDLLQVVSDPGVWASVGMPDPLEALSKHIEANAKLKAEIAAGMPFIKQGEPVPVGVSETVDKLHAEQAKVDIKNLDEALKAAQESATRERSPELFENFIAQHTNAKIGIDAEAVRKLYGDKPVEVGDGILGWVPGMKDQLPLAESHGGDVEIPLSEWLAYVDPDVAKELHDSIRVRPGGMTLEEAKERPKVGEQVSEPALGEEVQPVPSPIPEVDSVRQASKFENPSFAPEGWDKVGGVEPTAYHDSLAGRLSDEGHIIDGGDVELHGTTVKALYEFPLSHGLRALDLSDLPDGPDRFLTQFFGAKVQELGGDTPVHVVSAEDMAKLQPKNPKAPGYYYDMHGHIVLREDVVNGSQPTWVTNHVLLHEGVHAISVRELYNFPELRKAVRELMDVTDKALDPQARKDHSYAFGNEREFLAEGMSKSAFRDALAKVKLPENLVDKFNLRGKTGSVWEAFKNTLKELWNKLFGKVPDNSVLDAFFRIGEALEEVRKEDKKDEEVAAAEEVEPKTPFKTPGAMGLTPKQMKRFQELLEKRKEEDAKFQQEQGEKLERDRQTKEWKDNYPRVRGEAENDLKSRPDLASERYLRTGELYGEKIRKVRIASDSLTPEQIAKLPKEFVGKDGIHADDLAGLFGYTSGDAMVEGLSRLEAERGLEGLTPQAHYTKLLDAEADRRMRREFGDLEHNILEAAKDHVLGQTQMDLLHEEMLALGEQAHGQIQITRDDLKRWVKDQFNKTPLAAHSSAKYLAAAGRAGQASEDALLEGNPAEAFKAKQQQYIAALLANEARKLEKERASFDKTAKRFSKREVSGLPAEYTNWVHDILLRTGNFVRRSIQDLDDAKGRETHQTLEEFTRAKNADARVWEEDDEAPSDFQVMPVADFLFDPAYRKQIDEMSPDEFRAVHNSIKTIIKNGRDEQKITVAGEKADLKETIGKLTSQLETLFGGKGKQYAFGHKDTGVGHYVRTYLASLLQIESIFNRFDQGDPKGIFSRVLTRPIFSAANDRDTLESKYSKLYKAIPSFGDLKKKVDNPLFKDPLNNWETKQDFTRGNLLSVLQNVGNPYQLDKLARGYQIKDPNLIMQWLFGHTTKEDWDRAQAMGDLFEQVFEESARMYHSLSGVAPEKIDIRPIQTPFGEYRGWYHPIIYDPLRPGSSKKLMGPSAMEDGAYYRAATPSGYTKKRTGYAAPIQLNFEAVPAKLRSMINDIAMRPTVTDVSKVFYDPKFQMAMTKYYGKEVKDLMIPYLKDIAGMKQYKDAAQSAALKALEGIRQNVVATLIGFNPTTVLKHGPTAAMLSMKEVGAGNFLRELTSLASFNDDLGEKNWSFAMGRSEELQRRHRNWQETLTGAQANLFQENTLRNTVIKMGATPVAISDLLSAVPTWLAAYKDQIRQGESEGDAVGFADRAVRRAHGSSAVAARPRIMRGGPLAQFATPFYTFFNEMFQRQYEMAWKAKDALGLAREGNLEEAKKAIPGLMGGLWAYVVFPALIEQAVSPILTGKDSYTTAAIKWGARTIGSSFPILRDMIEAYLGNRDPTIGLYSTAGGMINDVIKDFGRGEVSMNKAHAGKTIRHAVTGFGALTGLTNAQEGKTGEFVYDVITGHQKPRNAAEVLNGLWHGQARSGK